MIPTEVASPRVKSEQERKDRKMNLVTLQVGRLVSEPETKETEEGKKIAIITLGVNRCYKNDDGIYDTDLISFILYGGIAEKVSEYCKKGDLVGVKGRLESKDNQIIAIAEKVSFLSSNIKEESKNEE